MLTLNELYGKFIYMEPFSQWYHKWCYYVKADKLSMFSYLLPLDGCSSKLCVCVPFRQGEPYLLLLSSTPWFTTCFPDHSPLWFNSNVLFLIHFPVFAFIPAFSVIWLSLQPIWFPFMDLFHTYSHSVESVIKTQYYDPFIILWSHYFFLDI